MDRPSSLLNEPVSATDYLSRNEPGTRLGAGAGLLIAIGLGLTVGLVVRALRPAPKPQERFAQLMNDLEDRLREIGEPAMNKVGAMAVDGAHAFSDRLHHREAQVEKFLRGAAKRLRQFSF